MDRMKGPRTALQEVAGRVNDPFKRVRALLDLQAELGAELDELARSYMRAAMAEARAAGHTWEEIGRHFGVTRQAAQQRWGQPPAD